MKCIICRDEVSRSEDAATEFTIWETNLGRMKEATTGRVAHILCLRGEVYDGRQMTIAEGIVEKERKESGHDLG